ncbi:MAG: hypothetical protein N3A69_10575 [Leptospiraceae bacterium]|nr:hypothetical protein [Leptospiraceae bacterium]
MIVRMVNLTGSQYGREIVYEYGEDLFGYYYLNKIKSVKEKRKIVNRWVMKDLATLIRTLDLELYKLEQNNYENKATLD